MREIKFRAWDKNKNKWAGNIEDYMFGEVLLDCPTESVVNTINILFSDKEDGLVWMEFTGLKDKKGKEIYEGDIVRTEIPQFGNTPRYENSEIKYNGCRFNIWEDYEKEVIGNIYENPKLLRRVK